MSIAAAIFLVLLAAAIWWFTRNVRRIRRNILLGRDLDRTDRPAERWALMTKVALGQSKMVVRHVAGLLHIVVYAGFVIINIEVLDKDLKVDTFRASGAGGQHINKTDSAIRITHMPTGIVVSCQADRSQHRNRAMAMDMLKARLYEAELRKREEASAAIEAQRTDIGWGHQLRSYVLQPYQMVKDLRTEVETSDTQGVLDGDIDRFLSAALAAKIQGGPAAEKQ